MTRFVGRSAFGLTAPIVLIAAALVTPGRIMAQEVEGFRVIVHESNPIAALSSESVADLFFKRATTWQTGAPAVPVDLADGNQVRDVFSRSVLGRSVQAVKAHWQQQIFSGSGTPPVEVVGTNDVVAFVASTPGAIGYIEPTDALPPGVRVVPLAANGAAAGGAAASTGPFQMEEVDELPVQVSKPELRFPPSLQRRGVEGSVDMAFVVQPDGTVDSESIRVLDSTHGAFEGAARDLVRRSVYEPGKRSGVAVPTVVVQRITFALGNR